MRRFILLAVFLSSLSSFAHDECEKRLTKVQVYEIDFVVNDLKSFQWAEIIVKQAKGYILSVDLDRGSLIVGLTAESYEAVMHYLSTSTIRLYRAKDDHEAIAKWYALELNRRSKWKRLSPD